MNKLSFSLKNWWSSIDKYILFSTFILLLFGIILVFSASQVFETKYNSSPNYLFKKHIIFCFLGLMLIILFSSLQAKNIVIISIVIFVISTILSIVAIFFFPETKGANRWIKIFNYSFQPSELLKPSFIIISALLISRYKNKFDNSLVINILLFSFISSILIMQPDFGMCFLVFSLWSLQMIMLNINFMFFLFFVFLIVSFYGFFFLEHVQFRIKNFFFSDVGDNYQIKTSLESFSNGGFFGKGIGNGVVSKNLPDVHSDFIFALAGEELGFVLSIIILLTYLFIFCRVFFTTKDEKNFFIYISSLSLTTILLFQALINISSSLNMIPTKGMTLPFISYGGSSMLSNSILIGFILALTRKE